MNAPAAHHVPVAIGAPHAGGFFGGTYLHGTQLRGLVWAPKAEGEFSEVRWHERYGMVAGALSFYDGLANTEAMAEAGSEIAKRVRALRIGGHEDWCIAAMDQKELAYRLLKPGTEKNDCWARSGINLSATPPTWPYTEDDPRQTLVDLFKEGGAEAFEKKLYWTSTQYRADGDYAWFQDFTGGLQGYWLKGDRYMVRAVRSFPI